LTTATVHVLGASSTVAPPGDSNACLHLHGSDRSVLIDAGGNIPQILNVVDEDYREITDVIITHSHPDHTYGFPFLSHAFYNSHQSIRCWSTSEAIPKLQASLESFELQEPDRYLDVEFEEVSTKNIDRIDLGSSTLTVDTFPTRHSRPGFGLKIRKHNSELIYSGDTSPQKQLFDVAEQTDYLLHDVQATEGYKRYFQQSHTSARELGEIADRVQPSVTVPFHHNLMEFPPSRTEIVSEIREEFDGPIVFPSQGMSFFL